MASSRRGRASDFAKVGARRGRMRARSRPRGAHVLRWLVVAMSAATLAACARSPDVSTGPDKGVAGNQAALTQAAPA
jgi:rare lipoprotein A